MAKKQIVFFAPDGRELLAYSADGMFEGELESTIGLLAYENGLNDTDISIAEIER